MVIRKIVKTLDEPKCTYLIRGAKTITTILQRIEAELFDGSTKELIMKSVSESKSNNDVLELGVEFFLPEEVAGY